MSCFYLYALLAQAPPPGSLPPATHLRTAGLWAVVESQSAAPELSKWALEQHDTIVRGLCATCPAVLPARFGQTAASIDELGARLAPRARELRAALAEVRGCTQMTVRVFPEGRRASDALESASGGPGRRYLDTRRRTRQDLIGSNVLALGAQCGARSQRARLHGATGLSTLYHLVPIGALTNYLARMDQAETGCRLAVSGPWPPYAFAEEISHASLDITRSAPATFESR